MTGKARNKTSTDSSRTFTFLGAEIILLKDVSPTEMITGLKSAAKKAAEPEVQWVGVFVLSHGLRVGGWDCISCVCGDLIKRRDIEQVFSSSTSPLLVGKPKIFNSKLSLLSSEECGSKPEFTSTMTRSFQFCVTAESRKKAEEMDCLSENDMKERQAVAESVDKELSVRLAGCRVSLYGSSLAGFGLKFSTIN